MSKAKKKTAAPKKSTALAVRKPQAIQITGLPPAQMTPVGQLGELATVGALGLAEIKLTDAEEAALSVAVNTADVLIKPDGVPYLPHIAYTRWFNAAFGRTGWSIVPTARPAKTGNLITVPYLLYIHGVPVAAAMGEQDYHDDNKRQTFGDAVEATVASALRRCAKRLGVGLEMWDKAYLQRFKDEHCIPVKVDRRGEMKTEWRRKVDPPLPGEQGGRKAAREDAPDRYRDADLTAPTWQPSAPNVVMDPKGDEKITNEQRKRLTDIAERAGRPAAEVTLWLKQRFGAAGGTKDVKRKDYAEVCRLLEARGPLTMPGDGQ